MLVDDLDRFGEPIREVQQVSARMIVVAVGLIEPDESVDVIRGVTGDAVGVGVWPT
jgi:hypothetical protein